MNLFFRWDILHSSSGKTMDYKISISSDSWGEDIPGNLNYRYWKPINSKLNNWNDPISSFIYLSFKSCLPTRAYNPFIQLMKYFNQIKTHNFHSFEKIDWIYFSVLHLFYDFFNIYILRMFAQRMSAKYNDCKILFFNNLLLKSLCRDCSFSYDGENLWIFAQKIWSFEWSSWKI